MKKTRLKDIATRAHSSIDKTATKKKTVKILEELNDLQNLLYAENRRSLLVVIQGMDASGKDGLIRDVFTSMNPQGVNVWSFKEPSQEELAHDFLWRVHKRVPPKGMIHIFNRSHYEDVLITRVHGAIDDEEARSHMHAINDFERLLSRNGTHILKFYLHVSREEQFSRLEERIRDPKKMWKYNQSDFNEAKLWDKYQECYEDVFHHCSEIPWHIIPADQNWYKSHLVADTIFRTLKDLKMNYPGIKK